MSLDEFDSALSEHVAELNL